MNTITTSDSRRIDSIIQPKLRNKVTYFGEKVNFRASSDMVDMSNFFVKNLKDSYNKPLFNNSSHFYKCAVIHFLRHLENQYPSVSYKYKRPKTS